MSPREHYRSEEVTELNYKLGSRNWYVDIQKKLLEQIETLRDKDEELK